MQDVTTWRALIAREMKYNGETWADVVHSVVESAESLYDDEPRGPGSFDAEFDPGYGRTGGGAFTVWTARRVYFPVQYDGSEWCASVPRDPCDVATEHVGGG